MSNGDFEVMPRGTMEELRLLREFVHDVDVTLSLSESEKNLRGDLRVLLCKLDLWYADHNDKYIV